ncbi:MAG: hypothetical protein WCL44_13195 [bacterium]
MNDTAASAILIIISFVVLACNVAIFISFKRKLRRIEDAIHK